MSGLFQKKEKLHREPVRWKKELKLAPGYLILTLWILFTLALLGWVLLASFSTTKEIFSNKLLDSGFHIENYEGMGQFQCLHHFLQFLILRGGILYPADTDLCACGLCAVTF